MGKDTYLRLDELGVPVSKIAGQDVFVCNKLLIDAVEKRFGAEGVRTFGKLFGVQTCQLNGVYPWDAEAVLEVMMSGRLTGSQLHWD
jgi:hypothetical protein